jgi:ribonuclease HI
MPLREMYFKDKRVFVEVDDQGALILDNGRARMRYKAEDTRVYGPSPANLSATGSAASLPLPIAAPPVPPPSAPVAAEFGSISAWTDGGCIGNPGPSGVGYVIALPDGSRLERGEPLGQGTNNIAELTAILRVVEQLDSLHVPIETPIRIHTDSTYAIGVLTANWKPKVNQELIAGIKKALKKWNITMVKVKGHAGNPDNERVDYLANTAARTQKTI